MKSVNKGEDRMLLENTYICTSCNYKVDVSTSVKLTDPQDAKVKASSIVVGSNITCPICKKTMKKCISDYYDRLIPILKEFEDCQLDINFSIGDHADDSDNELYSAIRFIEPVLYVLDTSPR